MTPFDINTWKVLSADKQKYFKNLLLKVDKNKVYKQMPKYHDAAFKKIDCLQCSACCKNYSPRFKTTDIKRISKVLGQKESVFIDSFLQLDTDGDYVTKSQPCPFLAADNYCNIYEDRPSDCRRFPYTNEDVLLKRPLLTQKNSTFCPAVYFVLNKIDEDIFGNRK
jgi:uncharacterized protein